jgi:hypothetical protein
MTRRRIADPPPDDEDDLKLAMMLAFPPDELEVHTGLIDAGEV